jgi:hypothetical protein
MEVERHHALNATERAVTVYTLKFRNVLIVEAAERLSVGIVGGSGKT